MNAPHRIEIPESFGLAHGSHVMIRNKPSWAAKSRVQTAGMVVHVVPGETQAEGSTSEVTIDSVARGLAVLETAVLSWHGVTDSNGEPIPASRAGYMHDDFDPDLGDWIVDAIEQHYGTQAPTEQQVKPVSSPSSEQ